MVMTEETATALGEDRDEALVQLAGALRTVGRTHHAYLAELGQGDVEPAEGWSTWIRRVPAWTELMGRAA
jgi:hypothetical protein